MKNESRKQDGGLSAKSKALSAENSIVRPYDYAHRQGVLEISWEDFAQYSAKLAEMIALFQPQVILGVARAGLFPATAVACWLQCEFFPVRITRRVNDAATLGPVRAPTRSDWRP